MCRTSHVFRIGAKGSRGESRAKRGPAHARTRSRTKARSDAENREVFGKRSFGAAGRADSGRAPSSRDGIRAKIHDGRRNKMRGSRRIQMDVRRTRGLDEIRWVHVPAAIVIGRTGPRVRGVRLPLATAFLAVRRRRTDRQRGDGACRRTEGAVEHCDSKRSDYGPCPESSRAQHTTKADYTSGH